MHTIILHTDMHTYLSPLNTTQKSDFPGEVAFPYIHIVSIIIRLFFTGAALGQGGRDLRLLLAHNVILKHGEDRQ